MIVSKVDWRHFYKVNPELLFLLSELRGVLSRIDCRNLSYSGGIDSTVLLFVLHETFPHNWIRCFTIADSEDHPDFHFAEKMTRELGVSWEGILIDKQKFDVKEEDCAGDSIVRQFYQSLEMKKISSIIACDGIDEYMGGYYEHLHQPDLTTYYKFLSELVDKHLVPLHISSGSVKVYLPYLDPRLVALYGNYELNARFDNNGRKKIMIELAKKLGVPDEIINRRKYGFCDAGRIKA